MTKTALHIAFCLFEDTASDTHENSWPENATEVMYVELNEANTQPC